VRTWRGGWTIACTQVCADLDSVCGEALLDHLKPASLLNKFRKRELFPDSIPDIRVQKLDRSHFIRI
jgi:hypothetical protein